MGGPRQLGHSLDGPTALWLRHRPRNLPAAVSRRRRDATARHRRLLCRPRRRRLVVALAGSRCARPHGWPWRAQAAGGRVRLRAAFAARLRPRTLPPQQRKPAATRGACGRAGVAAEREHTPVGADRAAAAGLARVLVLQARGASPHRRPPARGVPGAPRASLPDARARPQVRDLRPHAAAAQADGGAAADAGTAGAVHADRRRALAHWLCRLVVPQRRLLLRA
mmetsp:Transcript_21817/g.69637  ORF Transcript_21817/g.69637 Transcript_21817/m.69637 type:complete len:224 (-) Transcript_21817:36-707(-)